MPDSSPTDSQRVSGDASGLSFSDNCSVDWRRVDHALADDHLAAVNESNEIFLRSVAALGTLAGEHNEEEGAISAEIERLDRKINLVLDLVSQLVYQQLEIPDKCHVTISATDLAWQEPDPPGPGETLFVRAYIQHGTPKPLCFYGEVTSTDEDERAGMCRVRYLGLSPSVESWLDKLIFRRHRREVAFKRLHAGDK